MKLLITFIFFNLCDKISHFKSSFIPEMLIATYILLRLVTKGLVFFL